MAKYSIIVPVYNRPNEVDELLESLRNQTFTDFEILIVEDGSTLKCEGHVERFKRDLEINYLLKENSGQGFSRNYGFRYSTGEWLVFFDSDCIIPPDYFTRLEELLDSTSVSAFCGPDAASPDFSRLQKAISYSMTSIFTTGGIRGDKVNIDKTKSLRSYNMVVRSSVFKALEGFRKTNMGEDMEFSHRFQSRGYEAMISQELFVYHKRRSTLASFFGQIFSFGRTRILLNRKFGLPVKPVHFFPAAFLIGIVLSATWALLNLPYALFGISIYLLYFILILVDSAVKWKSLVVGAMSVVTSVVQLSAYGLGMIKEWINH